MKLTYQIFTVLLWITIVIEAFLFVSNMSRMNNVSLPGIIGWLSGAAVFQELFG